MLAVVVAALCTRSAGGCHDALEQIVGTREILISLVATFAVGLFCQSAL